MFKIKNKVYDVLERAESDNLSSRIVNIFLISLILLNLLLVIVETFNVPYSIQKVLNHVETISVIIFTVEYVLRVWISDLISPGKNVVLSRIQYIFSFMAIVDILAILPFYLPLIIPIDLRVLRTLRIIRLFRIFKINRYIDALSTIGKVFKRKASQLISSVIVVGLLMIISAVLMYNIENQAQPEQFSNAFSSLWWAIATLTTVGYGDIYPITTLGKILSAVIALLGIGLVAVPTGIITSGFMEVLAEDKTNNHNEKCVKKYCPYCGHKLDE